jgi:hypothetical protein
MEMDDWMTEMDDGDGWWRRAMEMDDGDGWWRRVMEMDDEDERFTNDGDG